YRGAIPFFCGDELPKWVILLKGPPVPPAHFAMNDAATIRRDLKPALVFLSGELIAVPIPLEREEVILGRALEADVRVNDTQVSRQHARIIATPTESRVAMQYVLNDLDSRNGTFLNGRRIKKEILENGD